MKNYFDYTLLLIIYIHINGIQVYSKKKKKKKKKIINIY